MYEDSIKISIFLLIFRLDYYF